jgi:hypothetical protein
LKRSWSLNRKSFLKRTVPVKERGGYIRLWECKPKEESDDAIVVHALFSLDVIPVAESIFTPEDTCPRGDFSQQALILFLFLDSWTTCTLQINNCQCYHRSCLRNGNSGRKYLLPFQSRWEVRVFSKSGFCFFCNNVVNDWILLQSL